MFEIHLGASHVHPTPLLPQGFLFNFIQGPKSMLKFFGETYIKCSLGNMFSLLVLGDCGEIFSIF